MTAPTTPTTPTTPPGTTLSPTADALRRAVTSILTAQRAAVLAVIDGLDETALRTPVLPSGWTAIGMVEHLARAEAFWFQHVVAGVQIEGPAQDGPEPDPYATDRPTAEVIAQYRRATELADGVLAGVAPEDRPRGWVPPDLLEFADDVATVCVHLVEETARHLGHLDVVRELLDGRTGLGPR